MKRLIHPSIITLLAALLLVAAVLVRAGGDPLALARLGTRFSHADPAGTEGYDGQFIYYIARDPRPTVVAPLIDDPPYRYQRILLPLLARALSFGSAAALPWVLIGLGLAAHAAGTWAVAELLAGYRVSRWYALIYGLWVGFLLALRLDLPEPLAYGLVAAAILAHQREKPALGWVFYGLALFTKEVAVFFAVAQGLASLWERRWAHAAGLAAVAGLPFAAFQGWLWAVFGRPGFGLGGGGVTGLEVIPFMGLWRIGFISPAYLLAYAVVFVPFVVAPAAWGIIEGARRVLARQVNFPALALLLNGGSLAVLTHSTFREPGGLLRFACGLVLAVLVYAARYRKMWLLNLAWLWLVMNVFLIKS